MFEVHFCLPGTLSGTGDLYESFDRAMQYTEIDSWKARMIGFGCDGAGTNIVEDGSKAIFTREVT